MMEKPDVDSIDGLSPGDLDRPEDDDAQPALDGRHGHRDLRLPAPALRARRPARTARSAAGRSRARASSRSSTRSCGCPRARASRSTRRSSATARASTATSSRSSRREGFTRVKVDGEQRLLEEEIVARQEVQAHDRGRRRPARDEGRTCARGSTQSVETAAQLADGLVVDRRRRRRGADLLREVRLPRARRVAAGARSRGSSPSTRRTAPARAAPASARSRRSTPTCSSPTRRSRSREGALVPWSVGNSSFYESVIQAIADRYEIDLDTPWQDLPERAAGPLPLRHRRRAGLRHATATGWGAGARTCSPSRASSPSLAAALPRDRLVAAARADRGVHELPAVPGLQGRAAEAGGARRHRRRAEHPRVHADVGDARRSSSSTGSS